MSSREVTIGMASAMSSSTWSGASMVENVSDRSEREPEVVNRTF